MDEKEKVNAKSLIEASVIVDSLCELGKQICTASEGGLALASVKVLEMCHDFSKVLELNAENGDDETTRDVDTAGLKLMEACAEILLAVIADRQAEEKKGNRPVPVGAAPDFGGSPVHSKGVIN